MKHIYLVTCCMLFSLSVFAQSGWVEPSAKWYLARFEFFPKALKTYQYFYYYDKDTVIDSKLYQIVKGIEASRLDSILLNRTIYGNKIDTLLLPDYYFYTEDDRVYLKKEDGSLQFLWDNSPAVNDIWRYGLQYDSVSNSFKEPFLKVEDIKNSVFFGNEIVTKHVKDSIGTPFIGGDSTAFIPYFNSALSLTSSNWHNAIMGSYYGFNLIGRFGSFLYLKNNRNLEAELNCYESDLNIYKRTSHPICNFLDTTLVTIDENKPLLKSLYPNPVSLSQQLYLTLQFGQPGSNLNWSLHNLQGQTISQHSLAGGEVMQQLILPSHILPGVYVLRVNNGSKHQTLKLLLLE